MSCSILPFQALILSDASDRQSTEDPTFSGDRYVTHVHRDDRTSRYEHQMLDELEAFYHSSPLAREYVRRIASSQEVALLVLNDDPGVPFLQYWAVVCLNRAPTEPAEQPAHRLYKPENQVY